MIHQKHSKATSFRSPSHTISYRFSRYKLHPVDTSWVSFIKTDFRNLSCPGIQSLRPGNFSERRRSTTSSSMTTAYIIPSAIFNSFLYDLFIYIYNIFYPCGSIMNTSKYSKKLASDIHPTGFSAFGFIFFRPSAWNGKELVISPPPRWFWGTMPRGHACNSMEICCILNRHPKNMWSQRVKHTRPKKTSVKWNGVVV